MLTHLRFPPAVWSGFRHTLCAMHGQLSCTSNTIPSCAQAERLWDLDAAECRRVLRRLLEGRFLHETPDGRYVMSHGRDQA
jgi:hypothetical protein